MPEFVLTSLEAVESVLTERTLELGVEVRRGVEVTGLTQDGSAVVAFASDGDPDPRSFEREARRWFGGPG